MKHLITIIIFAGLFICQQTKKEYGKITVADNINTIAQSDGKKLMENTRK